MKELLISCMDHRLNGFIDQLSSAQTILVRNAGANIFSIKESIKFLIDNNEISKIILSTHNDCGAMKVVFNSIKNKKNPNDDIYNKLVKQFEKRSFNTIEELEKINTEIQLDELEKIAKGIKIEVKTIDLSNYKSNSNEEHKLVYSFPDAYNYEELSKKLGINENEIYFIHANHFDEIKHDLDIAIDYLGIKDINFLATKASDYREMNKEMNLAMLKNSIKNINLNFIKL